MGATKKDRRINAVLSVLFTILCIAWLYPVFMILMNSLKTERAIGNQWLVSEGLKAGDKLIVEGLQKARPGSPVTAVPAGSKAPAAQGGAANAPADKAAAEKK